MPLHLDLENHIRQSYELIKQYESIIQLSDNPKEQARCRRIIDEQWELIRHYFREYVPVCNKLSISIPEDISLIWAMLSEPKATPTKQLLPQSANQDRDIDNPKDAQHSKDPAGKNVLVHAKQEPRLAVSSTIRSYVEKHLWGQYLLLILFLIGVLEGIVGIFDVHPLWRRSALAISALLGGLVIWGQSHMPYHRHQYRSWDRRFTLSLVIVAFGLLGWLTYLEVQR